MTNLQTARQIRKEFSFDIFDTREVLENIVDNESDFEVNNYRFINNNNIDEIMRDELESDEYTLGCFNSWFLTDVLEIDEDVIVAMQNAEAYEALGKLIISMGKLDELQSAYASADGYGAHFGHYDGNEIEIGNNYTAFRIN